MLEQITFSCVILISCCSHWAIAEKAQVVQSEGQISTERAQAWLAVVDKGQYEQSWETASTYFKSMVTNEQWVAQISAVRNPLGDLISRELINNLYQKTLPGVPDGEYYVMTFNTVFKNKASAVETVILMKDQDGQWCVGGYFIK